jgi:hypothetical protein
LLAHYRTTNIGKAFRHIARLARDGDLISGGHIDFPSVRRHIGRPIKMITLFRNPIARARSEYNYCRQAYLMKSAVSRLDMSIKHRMAGRFSFRDYLDYLSERPDAYGNIAARYIGWDGHQNLDEFFAQHVFHSGVLEDNAAFASEFARKIGKPSAFPHRNKSTLGAAIVGTRERAKIEQLYPWDFQVFEWQLAQLRKAATPADVTLRQDWSIPLAAMAQRGRDSDRHIARV